MKSRGLGYLVIPVLFLLGNPATSQAAEPTKAKASDAVQQAAAALYEGIRVETLPNGLRVFLKPVPGSAVITTMVAYKVGSADEELDQTGLAHYLEHLLFKGTDKLVPGDIDRLTLRNGGSNNAFTSEDVTVYHFDFAAEHWEVPLKIEADRMRNTRIDAKHEFDKEKGAVIQELNRNEDRPWDLEFKAVGPLLFGKSGPYGHPVIGERDHVRGATAEIIKRYYDQWYHPNNAVLVVAGGFDADVVFARIKELFGPIPRQELPARKEATAAKRKGPAKEEFKSKFDVARMVMGFNTIRTGEPDSYALQVAQEILSGGKTSRLYQKLIEGEEIATMAQTGNSTGRYPGWFGLYVELLQGKNRDQAEQLVLAELKKLRDEPVSDAELKRVKQGLIAGAVFARESVHALADSIAVGVTNNDLDYLKTYLPRIAAVTAEDIQRVARKYFDPEQRVVVWSVPEERKAAAGESTQYPVLRSQRSGSQVFSRQVGSKPVTSPYSVLRTEYSALAAPAAAPFSLKSAQRVVLPNGLTLLLYENHSFPIFVADVQVRNVRLLEPESQAGLATLVSRLLDEGTAKHTGQQIAELIEDAGGQLSPGLSSSSVKVLAPDRKLGLGLLFECLLEPAFPKDAFTRVQQQLLSEIADLETQPDEVASQLYMELLYGKHPFGRPALGRAKIIEKLTPEECRALHRKLCVPNNTVVALVGDFDSKQVTEEITKLTAGWKASELTKPKTPPISAPEKFLQRIVSMPDAAQLHFYMGHPAIRRNDPDYYKLLVMDYVLGTGPGFTDRLSARLRDREGLAYTVSANITSAASDEPGLFTCYIGTEAQSFEKVKSIFLEELKRIREEPPTAQEVEDAKKYLLGNLPFRFTTNGQIAGQLQAVERYNLGFDYLDTFRKQVSAVTPAEVQAVAKKHLNPLRMVLVAAGALDQNGRPLLKLPAPKP